MYTWKKMLKWTITAILLFLILGTTFIIGSSYIEHKKLIELEKKDFPAPGVLVDVNGDGNKLHVYTKGEGNVTLVFMSGLGTSSPVYDFKVLYNKLAKDYRIAVVERAGYGWSDITSSSRKINTVLEETRTALQLAGEKPPYVLFPHSLAGLESIYWANLYPEEVKAIVGLEPLVPEYYEKTKKEPSFSRVIDFLMKTGLARNQPDIFENNFHAMNKGHLTEDEAEIAKTIFFRRVQTKNMWEEINMLPANSKTVYEKGKPNTPFYAFISDENKEEHWKESIISYAKSTQGEYFILDGNHYIHLDYPKLIANESKKILKKIKN